MISILTCPRPDGVSYVEPLLEAIQAELPDERLEIVRDVPTSPPNNKHTGWRALALAAEHGEDLLFLEDDVRPAFPGALAAAAAYEVPAWAAFTSLHQPRPAATLGAIAALVFQMSQAVKIPRRSLDWLLRFPTTARGDWEAATGFDLALAAAGRAAAWSYEQAESYFRHVGVVSAARPGYYWQSEQEATQSAGTGVSACPTRQPDSSTAGPASAEKSTTPQVEKQR